MRGLNDLFGQAFDEVDRYLGAPAPDDHLVRLLQSGTFIALVAVEGEKVIGGLAAYELVKFERETCQIYIYDLAVAEAHRRMGVATALIGRLRAIAGERCAEVIFVQADREDDPAISLYTKLGSREDVHHFDIPVGPKTPVKISKS